LLACLARSMVVFLPLYRALASLIAPQLATNKFSPKDVGITIQPSAPPRFGFWCGFAPLQSSPTLLSHVDSSAHNLSCFCTLLLRCGVACRLILLINVGVVLFSFWRSGLPLSMWHRVLEAALVRQQLLGPGPSASITVLPASEAPDDDHNMQFCPSVVRTLQSKHKHNTHKRINKENVSETRQPDYNLINLNNPSNPINVNNAGVRALQRQLNKAKLAFDSLTAPVSLIILCLKTIITS
jgi:hypothetical protein